MARGRSPCERGRSPCQRGRSAVERGRSPAERGRSPAERGRSPAERGRSPAERGRSPCERGRSAAERGLSPRERAPSAEDRAVPRGLSAPGPAARPRAWPGDEVRFPGPPPSAADVRAPRRGPSPTAPRDVPGLTGAFAGFAVRRWPSPAPSARPLPVSRPAPRGADLPRPRSADSPDGRGRLPEVLEFAWVPEAVRPVFGLRPPARPPLALSPRGAPRPSATSTNLQHLPQHSALFNNFAGQTSEEGRSTSSGATLFKHVRRRPTLPRGPPRSTIGAEGLNFRVRNGTGCFPFAITAETLLRCHRPTRACRRPYLGNRTVDAKQQME